MDTIHFLNVLEGDCNIIQHSSNRVSVIDVSNAFNTQDTIFEKIVRASEQRRTMRLRTQVPLGKVDYRQKHTPDNPIEYLKRIHPSADVFRFIVTHPDMDHLDGIRDFFEEFKVTCYWDTNNNKVIERNGFFAGYNYEDWEFYLKLRSGSVPQTRMTQYNGVTGNFWTEDNWHVLAPSQALVHSANTSGDFHDSSYVLLFTPPKANGGTWKFLFAGDSHDSSWDFILKTYRSLVSNVDVLFAPHHGRDSNRSYAFLDVLKPKLTLFGNASSEHLAYSSYPETRITNNQAGYVILQCTGEHIVVSIKNVEFAQAFTARRGWPAPVYNPVLQAYPIIQYNSR